MNLQSLMTEQKNMRTLGIDTLDSLGIAKLMNEEDLTVALSVRNELHSIAKLIDLAAEALNNGGRVIYAGAGTSGRLGVLDASEIPPTFNAPEHCFVGMIAGGDIAIRTAVEGAEDKEELGSADVTKCQVGSGDLVIGLTASGRTPYVKGALRAARENGAKTGLIACNKYAAISPIADVAVEVEVGPEVIMGSTRLKAGTAQKLVLNMVSTGAMVLQGKVYGNLMVDMQTTNEKLRDRAIRIIGEASGKPVHTSADAYNRAGGRIKEAIVHLLTGENPDAARTLLEKADGKIKEAIKIWKS